MSECEARSVAQLIREVRDGLDELGHLYPHRRFTLDGHAVGSLGEVVAETLFGLTLAPASNTGFDACDPNGNPVEIKATFGTRVVFRASSHDIPGLRVIVLNLNKASLPDLVVFNGLYSTVASVLPSSVASNGQRQLSLAALRSLDVPEAEKLPVVGSSVLEGDGARLPRYRVLTGIDDAEFCHRVSEALGLGYELHGSPSLTTKDGEGYLAQALVWGCNGAPPLA